MLESKLSHIVDPLRELICQHALIVKGFRERSGARAAGLTCGMFPEEIAASAGVVPLRVPHCSTGACVCEGMSSLDDCGELYDNLAVPRSCSGKGSLRGTTVVVHDFDSPAGWGPAACGTLGSSLDKFLTLSGCAELASLDSEKLRSATMEYNAVRRLVRGISSVRREKPDLLSCRDLSAVFEAAAVFPPAVMIEHLATILASLGSHEGGHGRGLIQSLAYASFIKDALLLDEIEEAGCLIVEDDFCSGRRQFEMSYDHDASDLLADMLDSYSYRPRCPSVRPVEERYELFYRMMKGQGIELVVFIEDYCCPARQRDIDGLRTRLMRSGVDPIVVTSANAVDKIRSYTGRI